MKEEVKSIMVTRKSTGEIVETKSETPQDDKTAETISTKISRGQNAETDELSLEYTSEKEQI